MGCKAVFILSILLTLTTINLAQECIECHKSVTPNVASDWQISKHSQNEVTCSVCHGDGHTSAEDVAKVEIPTPETCATCHEQRVEQFKQGKHAFAWAAMNAMPTTHWQPMDLIEGMKGCGGCHKIGLKSGQNKILSENVAAPTCQTCHMADGDHGVRTAWGFLAVRLPLPEDEEWKADRITILQAMALIDLDGNPTYRLEVAQNLDMARTTEKDWQDERDKMVSVCSECHSENFARGELRKGDKMIKEADHLLAEAIRSIAGLYEDGVLEKPETYFHNFPDLLTFHDAPTEIEQKLFVMHLAHRMRAFGNLPCQSRLCVLVRLECDEKRSDRNSKYGRRIAQKT